MHLDLGEKMKDRYVSDRAIVSKGKIDAITAMKSTPMGTIQSILGRIGIEYEKGLPKEVYLSAFKEEFCSDSKWILIMLPGIILDFLVEIWDNSSVEMNEERWNFIEYLKIFGMLSCQRGSAAKDSPNKIFVVQEMKDNFYFLLKSKKNRQLMWQYEEWEKYITGLMYYYGLIEIKSLYEQFQKNASNVISYQEFITFLKCRCSLWVFGTFLQETNGNKEYFQYVNVDNPEMLLVLLNEEKELPYKKISTEDLIYISEASGIDNRWEGVSELGNLFVNEMGLHYYRATVLIKTLISMVQNGCSYNKLRRKVKSLSFQTQDCKEEMGRILEQLYYHVPVFEYKGHSREEYHQMFYEKELKKKRKLFTIIEGGKD